MREAVEDGGETIGGNPDAGVGDCEMQSISGAILLDQYRRFAALGEFSGVAEQVQKDLPEPARDRR